MVRDGVDHLAQNALFIRLPQAAQVLGVAAAMRHHFVAALADRIHDLRRVLV